MNQCLKDTVACCVISKRCNGKLWGLDMRKDMPLLHQEPWGLWSKQIVSTGCLEKERGRSYCSYFRGWVHRSQVMEGLERQRTVKHVFHLPSQKRKEKKLSADWCQQHILYRDVQCRKFSAEADLLYSMSLTSSLGPSLTHSTMY